MLRNNHRILICAILAVSLLLTVPSAQAQEDILDKIPSAQPAKTFQVVTTSVSNNTSSMVEVRYPENEVVVYESSGYFEKCFVSIGDEVKAGDVLAQFTKVKDEVQFTRLELALNQAEQALSEGVRQRKEQIAQIRDHLTQITDPYEKEITELTLEYHETELELYRYNQQKNVDRQREALEEATADLNYVELIATADGYVSDIARCARGDYFSNGSFYITLQQQDTKLLALLSSASFSAMRYNLPVTMTFQGEQLTGRIVYASDAIPLVSQTDAVYIELDPEFADRQVRSASMTCDLMGLGNIAIIPLQFLKTDKEGNTYVFLQVDGTSQRRYVQCLYKDSDYAVIPMGLNDGDILSMY